MMSSTFAARYTDIPRGTEPPLRGRLRGKVNAPAFRIIFTDNPSGRSAAVGAAAQVKNFERVSPARP